eukprot:c10945_g1_i1.p1 GENE.c10945_g1_i1~~c10945_g1_i1.p1  ORF type:complete len:396 (+),score=67.01 c10945_g1_i1:171-1190(+)
MSRSQTFLFSREISSPTVLVLSSAFDWINFDVFALHHATGGHALSCLEHFLFNHFELFDALSIDEAVFREFWHKIEIGYQDVPYHNQVHAADVLAATAFIISQSHVRSQLSPFELCASLFAAGIHDHDHPGFNNRFLVETNHPFVKKYGPKSVLEYHHIQTGLVILDEVNFIHHTNISEFKRIVTSMVLATDMACHFDLLARFETAFPSPESLQNLDSRQLLLDQILHCADISNCLKPFHFAEHWGELVVKEFHNQGDQELKLGITSPDCNLRKHNAVALAQRGFLQNLVVPMYEKMVIAIPPLQQVMANAEPNVDAWNRRMKHNDDLLLKSTSIPPNN